MRDARASSWRPSSEWRGEKMLSVRNEQLMQDIPVVQQSADKSLNALSALTGELFNMLFPLLRLLVAVFFLGGLSRV
jgi:hypothetical protein